MRYLLADHLGSTVGSITSGGAVTTNKYYPYGAPRVSGPPSSIAFTGQRRENTLGGAFDPYYYGARFYSTELGHFLSPDPLTVDGYNRYQYVRGNPLRYTDPTGLCGEEMNILWDSCTLEKANYVPGDLTPVAAGCSAACKAAANAQQAIVDGMRAGAAYEELRGAMLMAEHIAGMEALASAMAFAVPEEESGGGPIGRFFEKLTGAKSDVASIGLEGSVCVVACGSLTVGLVSTDSGTRPFFSWSGGGSIGIGANATIVGTAGNQKNGATGFEGFGGGSFVWQACGAGEVLVGCAEGAHNRQYDGVGLGGGLGFNVALNPIPSINPSAGGSYTYVFPWGF